MSTTDGRSPTYSPRKSYDDAAARARANGMRRTSASPPLISSLARAAMTEVASVSAGPPCGGLYLKPPSAGGLCDGVTTMPSARPGPVCRPPLALMIAWETAGRRRVAVVGVDQHRHVVGREHLERRRPRRLGQPVGVAADEQRAVVPLLLAVVADRLRGRQDVRLVERRLQAAAAVPAGAEGDLLVDVLGVGNARVVRRHEVRDVDQVGGSGEGSCAGRCRFWAMRPSCRRAAGRRDPAVRPVRQRTVRGLVTRRMTCPVAREVMRDAAADGDLARPT